MEILQNFGFEPILFIAQIVNFLIIFWLLKKILYQPVLKMLDERKTRITEGLRNADEAEKRLQQSLEKERELLKKAQLEAKKMLEEARQERTNLLQEAEVHTKKQVDKMLADAREQIHFEAQETEKKLTAHVSTLAIQFLQKSVGELFTDKEQDIVMEKAIKKLKERAD